MAQTKNIFEFSLDAILLADTIKYLRRCMRNKPLKPDEMFNLKCLISEMVCDTIDCKITTTNSKG